MNHFENTFFDLIMIISYGFVENINSINPIPILICFTLIHLLFYLLLNQIKKAFFLKFFGICDKFLSIGQLQSAWNSIQMDTYQVLLFLFWWVFSLNTSFPLFNHRKMKSVPS